MGRRRAAPAVVAAHFLLLLSLLLAAVATTASAASSSESDTTQVLQDSSGDAGSATDDAWVTSIGGGYSFSSGGASSAADHIAFVPERVDLGRVHACALRSFFVSIENRGPRRMRLQRADFTRENLALATDVAGIHLDPGGRFLVELRYLPTEPAAHYGAFFRVLTSSGRFSLPIHSRVEPNPAGVKALRLTVPVGANVHHTITLRNPKASTLRVTDVFTLEDRLHLSFPGGESAITPRRSDPRDQDQTDKLPEDARGPWELAAGASKPLVKLSFRTEEPGEFLSYVNIHAEGRPYIMVPVRVAVLKEHALTVEPSVIDVGVLTSRQQPHRETVTVYNTLTSPVTIDRVRVSPTASKASSPASIDVRMVGRPFILASRTRADVTLQLEFTDNTNTKNSDASSNLGTRSSGSTSGFVGDFDVAVEVEASIISGDSSGLDSPSRSTSTTPLGVRIVGKSLHGAVAYRERDTMFALTLPLTYAFLPESTQDRINESEMNVSIPLPMSVMPLGAAATASTLMESGTHLTRAFSLQNQFDAPLELERVYIDSDSDDVNDDLGSMFPFAVKEATISHFNQSAIAAPGRFWPEFMLDLVPSLDREDLTLRGDGELLAPRAYSLVVETNATIHKIPLHFYHGVVQVKAMRGLSRHSLSGFANESTISGNDDLMEAAPNEQQMKNTAKVKTPSKKQQPDIDDESEDDYLSRSCASVFGSKGITMLGDTLTKPSVSETRRQGSKPPSPFGVRVCRSLQFDLGKIAIRGGARSSETLSIMNWNPIPIEMTLSRVEQPELFTLDIHAEMKSFDESDGDDDGVPEALSALHARWQSNASFIRSNELRLAALSNQLKNDIADDGDQDASLSPFVIPPGHSVELHLDMRLAGKMGKFTAHVLTLRTPFEVIHMHAFLDIVDGTVEPAQPEVELSPAFAGQAQLVELHYRNTFSHAVRITNVTVPAGMTIATVPDIIPAKSERALTLYFVPSDVQLCAGRRMVVDCLLPPLDVPVGTEGNDRWNDGRNHGLSDFGMYVSPSDLIALARRNEFWNQVAGHNNGVAVLREAISGLVELETDLVPSVPPVTFSIPVARPRILVSGVSEPSEYEANAEPGSNFKLEDAPVKVHFPMTQLFHVSHAFVNVSNPANSTIHAELVCAYAQRRYFYMCDEQDDASSDDDHECLEKWRELVVDAASRPTCHIGEDGNQDSECSSVLIVNAPLFSFRHRIVEIPPGEHGLLGPIYYLPGYTHQVTAELYVRNQLSHIEPMHLVASSGKPTLTLSVITPLETGVSVKNDSSLDSKNKMQSGSDHHGNSILEFVVDKVTDRSDEESREVDSPDFSRRANLQIANTGEFDLQISKVWMVDRSADSSDGGQAENTLPFEILTFPGQITLRRSKHTEDGTLVVGENGAVAVLTPGDWMQFGIVFHPTCFTATSLVDMLIETNDDRRVIPLAGSITTAAAFECAQQRRSPWNQLIFRALWTLSVLAGSSCVALVLVDMVRSVVVSSTFLFRTKRASPEGLPLGATESMPVSADMDSLAADVSEADEGGLSVVCQRLDELDQAPFKPTLPVALPAVRSVLERRQRGAFDPAAILKSLTGSSEQQDGDLKTAARVDEAEKSSSGRIQVTVASTDKRVPNSELELLEAAGSDAVRSAPEVVAVESLAAANSDESTERSESEVDDTLEPLSDRPTPVFDAYDITATSDSTSTDKSIDAGVGSLDGGHTKQPDDLRVLQSRQVDNEQTEDSPGKSSSIGEFSPSFGFPTLAGASDIGGSKASSKRDDDPAWSMWDSKSWWQSSTENNLLESNRSLGGTKERGGGVLLPLPSFDSPPALGFGLGGGSSSALRGFEQSSPSPRLDSAFGGAMLSDVAPPTRPRGASATKAPPGFTPADAAPLEARAAFEKLRPGVFSASSERGRDVIGSVRDGAMGLERGVLPSSDGLSAGSGPLSLLAMLEPSSQPLASPFSSGAPLFGSPGNSSSELGGGYVRSASPGEIGSKRLASFREIWTNNGASEGRGAGAGGADAGA